MTLMELLHVLSSEKEKGLINIDDWKMTEADHLKTMGFEFDGDYTMSLKDPHLRVYKKKMPQGDYWFVEEQDKQARAFPKFQDVINFFDHFSQPEIDKERS